MYCQEGESTLKAEARCEAGYGASCKVRYKIWLVEGGTFVFGDGLATLLQTINELGSINRAAATLRMSYREAWGRIKKAETGLGVRLLDRHTGGEMGGGAQLTGEGIDLLNRYRVFRNEVDESIRKIFAKNFEEFDGGTNDH